jgi:hypothetical protein
MVTIGKALEWMMHGYPIRMSEWQDNEYLRYSELSEMFYMHVEGEYSIVSCIDVEPQRFCDPCWVLGRWHPAGKDPIWNSVEVLSEGA